MIFLFFIFFPIVFPLDIYVRFKPDTTLIGTGTLLDPYNNLINAFALTSIATQATTGENTIDFILMSDYYIIQDNDWNAYNNNVNILSSTGKFFVLFSKKATYDLRFYPLKCKIYNLIECPQEFKSVIIFKNMQFILYMSNSFKMYNIKFSGKDLRIPYNSTCWLSPDECCTKYQFTNPNSDCYLQDLKITKVVSNAVLSMFYLRKLSVSVLTSIIFNNFEITDFYALNPIRQTAYYNCIFNFQATNPKPSNISFIIRNSNFKSFFFFGGIMKFELFGGISSSLIIINTTFSDNNLYRVKDGNAIIYEILFKWYASTVTLDLSMNVENTSFINCINIFKIYYGNFTFKNVKFINIDKIFNDIPTNDGIFISSLSDTSNYIFENIIIDNITIGCFSNLDKCNFRFFLINNYLNINSFQFTNINSFKVTIFKFYIKSQIIINNLEINNFNCSNCLGPIIEYLDSSTILLNNTKINVVSFLGLGLFQLKSNMKILIENSEFINILSVGLSNSNDGNGKGVIFYMDEKNELIFFNSKAKGITALQGSSSFVYANGIENIIIIKNSSFYECSTFDKGSLITIINRNNTLNIIFSYFESIENEVIYFLNSDQIIIIYNSTFYKIDNYMSTKTNFLFGFMNIDKNNDVKIENNNFFEVYFFGKGGIIQFTTNNNITIKKTIFKNLYTKETGGFIYGNEFNNIVIENCEFNNINSILGQLIFLLTENYLFISRNLFKNIQIESESSINGGLIYSLDNCYIYLKQNNLTNLIISNSNGGLLYSINSQLLIIDLIITSFTGKNIINIEKSSYLYLYKIYIYSLIASAEGGFLYSSISNIVQILSSSFNFVNSNNKGGIFYLGAQNQFNISDITISNFNTLQQGAILYSNNQNNIYFIELFINNITTSLEGGLSAFYSSNNITIFLLNVYNSSSKEGSIICLINGFNIIYIKKSNFKQLKGQIGGFLSTIGNLGKNNIEITDCYSVNSSASTSGGFISFGNSFNIIKISNTIIEKSFSLSESGGLFYFIDSNTLTLFNVSINESKAELTGGLINCENFNIIYINNCSIADSKSINSLGGLIYLDQNNEINIENSNFTMVYSSMEGGGIYSTLANNIKIIKCSFFNISSIQGVAGFIYIYKNNTVFINLTNFYEINSALKGVFIYATEDNIVNLTNIIIENKLITYGYSIIHAEKNSKIYLLNSKLYFSEFKIDCYFGYTLSATFYSRNNNFFQQYSLNLFLRAIDSTITILDGDLSLFYSNYMMIIQTSIVTIKDMRIETYFYSNILLDKSSLLIDNCRINSKKSDLLSNSFIKSINSNISLLKTSFLSISTSFSGGILNIQDSSLKIINCFFSLISSSESGGVISVLYNKNIDESIIIKNSIFTRNRGGKQGGSLSIISLEPNLVKILISKTKFTLSLANIGGSISLDNPNFVNITDSKFIYGNAISNKIGIKRGKAGGIYYNGNGELNYERILLENNKAEIGGGLYFNGVMNYKNKNNVIKNNKGIFYGDNEATDIKKIVFITSELNKETRINVSEVISGYQYENCLFKIGGIDLYENIAFKNDDTYYKSIQTNQLNQQNKNQFTSILTEGFLCFNGKFIRSDLPIKKSFIYNFIYKNSYNITSEITLKLSFRDCILGERLTDQRVCEPCSVNTHSFVRDFTFGTTEKCKRCDETTNFYCFGHNKLTTKENYWRYSDQSISFIKCKNNACLGDIRKPSLLDIESKKVLYDPKYIYNCEEGYEGILCNECKKGYGHIDEFSCLSCDSSGFDASIAISMIVRIIFTVFSTYQQYLMVCSICSADLDKNEVITTNILKTFVNHMQILSIIRAFPFQWPEQFTMSLGIFLSFTPNVSEGMSFECYLKEFGSLQYFKLIVCSLYPFVLLTLTIIFIKLMQLIRKDKMKFLIARRRSLKQLKTGSPVTPQLRMSAKKSLKTSETIAMDNLEKLIPHHWVIISSLLCILILCFPDIIKVVLQIFSCINVGDDNLSVRRLNSDYTVDCESDTYKNWSFYMGIPFLFIIGFIFPLLLLGNMCWAYSKKRMANRDILFKYGFFYYAYKPHMFFWDLITLIRKFLLLFINIFLMTVVDINKDLSPILLVFIILVFSALLQYQYQPFDNKKFSIVNKVESISLSVLVITVLATIFYFQELLLHNEININTTLILVFIILATNIGFLAYFLLAFYIYNVKPKLKKIKESTKMIVSKLQSFKTSIQSTNLWNSIAKRFSKRTDNSPYSNTPLTNSPDIIKKSMNLGKFSFGFKKAVEKELFSPLKSPSAAEKKEEKRIMCILRDFLIEKSKIELEKINLLEAERRKILKNKFSVNLNLTENKTDNDKKKDTDITPISRNKSIDFNQKSYKIEEKNNEKIDIVNFDDIELVDSAYSSYCDIPDEKEESKTGRPKKKYINETKINRLFYNLACLKTSNILIQTKIADVNCKTGLKNTDSLDFYLKITLIFKFNLILDNYLFDIINTENYSVYFKEITMKDANNQILTKKFRIYLRLQTIPLIIPQAVFEMKTIKGENKFYVLLPCSLIKFLNYQKIISDDAFLIDFINFTKISKNLEISKEIASDVYSLQEFFPHSIICHIVDLKTNIPEDVLIVKTNILFLKDFSLNWKIKFVKTNEIFIEIGFEKEKIKEKLYAEKLLEELEKILKPA